MAEEMGITQHREIELRDPKYTQCIEITKIPQRVWNAINVLNGSYAAGAFSKAIDDSYEIFYGKKPLADPHNKLTTSILDIAHFLHNLSDNFIQFDDAMTKDRKYLILFLCCFIFLFFCLI